MAEPWRTWIKPAALKPYANGTLPPSLLARIPTGNLIRAQMYAPAAAAFTEMFRAAKLAGITLKSSGKQYRPLKAQESLFFERMRPYKTDRKPPVTRTYKGKRYWLYKGAPVATPGFSVHGFGCAADIDTRNEAVYKWLCANAPKYGFYLAGPRIKDGKPNPNFERHHWQWSTW